MQTLDLGNNLLTGKLPPQLGSWGQLTQLNVSGNMLTGEVSCCSCCWCGTRRARCIVDSSSTAA